MKIEDLLPTRRELLRYGGLGILGASAFASPLRANSTAKTKPRGSARNVIFFELAGAGGEIVNATPSESRAWLRRGGTLTFRLERWSPESVELVSPNFGKVKCASSVFERLVFGPQAFKASP